LIIYKMTPYPTYYPGSESAFAAVYFPDLPLKIDLLISLKV